MPGTDLVAGISSKIRPIMISDVAKYLRELAQTCTCLARVCPHLATSQGLEEIAADLMAKARELEELYGAGA